MFDQEERDPAGGGGAGSEQTCEERLRPEQPVPRLFSELRRPEGEEDEALVGWPGGS